MSSISGVKPSTTPVAQPTSNVGTDADGDNDGSKAATSSTTAPFVAKPTVNLGNNVNTTA